MRRIAILVALVVALGACVASSGPDHPNRPPSELTIASADGAVTLYVEVARSPEQRARGLMGRTTLPADQGMVFLFDHPVHGRFWMKDTLIPLSIAFWDGRLRIVSILDMEPCESDPCPTYGPDEPYVGAVEANRGFFELHGVDVGDRVELVESAYQ